MRTPPGPGKGDGVRPRDHLSLIVASAAIVGPLGLSMIIGPTTGPEPALTQQQQQRPADPGGTVAPPEASGPGPVEPGAPARAVPLRVRIGAISVDAPVIPVGLEDDGAMEIPDRVAEIGWYDPDGLGVRPGTVGTAVLAGHVDSRRQGNGALFHLRDLQIGETIEIDLADGTTQRWIITQVTQYSKDELPLEEVFTWSGAPRLAVITCGGTYDRTERSYSDNIVVYAEPADTSPTV
jgi:hypothetical protein